MTKAHTSEWLSPWLGLAMTATSPKPGTAIVVHECPADRVENGRAAQKGRSELTVTSSSPQAFRVEMKSTIYPAMAMEGIRIGNCTPR